VGVLNQTDVKSDDGASISTLVLHPEVIGEEVIEEEVMCEEVM